VLHPPFVPAPEIKVNDDVERFTLSELSPPQWSSPTPLDLSWSVQLSVDLDVDVVASHTQDGVLATSHVESRFQGPLGVDLRREESLDAVVLVITVLCTKLNAPDPSCHRHRPLAQMRKDQLRIGDDEFNWSDINDVYDRDDSFKANTNPKYHHDDTHFGNDDFRGRPPRQSPPAATVTTSSSSTESSGTGTRTRASRSSPTCPQGARRMVWVASMSSCCSIHHHR
jgi:hypothetical protein